jgi:lipopolysaccharide export system protein LptA
MSTENLFSNKLPNLIAVILVCLGSLAYAEDEELDFGVDTSLPITLDADSSEFDRRNDKLMFRGLRITQGALGIRADNGEAKKLDFENSLWVFTGNVRIDSAGAVAFSDSAEMTFKDHQLKVAVLRGKPARFEQARLPDGKMTEGHANTMEYDFQGGIIRMLEDAWLSDGANEVSGNRITYDLTKEYIIADADDNGQIRMKINPPEKYKLEGTSD